MEVFTKTVNAIELLTFFAELSILHDSQGYSYTSDNCK